METTDKWDIRFLDMARLVSTWSKDPSTQTGAVIVRPDRSIVSVGFNGFPRVMQDSNDRYSNREEKYSRIIHCEVNALLNANQPITACTLYTVPFLSCDRCAVQMIQAGIIQVVAPILPDSLKERWGAQLTKSKQYFVECGVIVKELGVTL